MPMLKTAHMKCLECRTEYKRPYKFVFDQLALKSLRRDEPKKGVDRYKYELMCPKCGHPGDQKIERVTCDCRVCRGGPANQVGCETTH